MICIKLTCYKFTEYNIHDWQSSAGCDGGNNRHCVKDSCEVVRVAKNALWFNLLGVPTIQLDNAHQIALEP